MCRSFNNTSIEGFKFNSGGLKYFPKKGLKNDPNKKMVVSSYND